MSNSLALASVTAVLRQLLYTAVKAEVSTATVKVGRPEAPASGTTETALHLFLYQVAHNPRNRNEELPTRRADGSIASRPRLALDLSFLLSAYGDSTLYEPERILGVVLRTLHTQPILSRDLVRQALELEIAGDPDHPLSSSDLADQVEQVRLTPLAMDTDAMSKLWGVFFQTPYVLSVAYQASVVFIDGEVSVSPALPVLTRNLTALPRPTLVLEAVEASTGRTDPLTASSTLVLRGQGFSGGQIRVRLAGQDFVPTSASGTRLTFDLSSLASDALRAGPVPVQVVRWPTADDGSTLAFGFESNAVPIVLRPEATVSGTSTPLGLTLTVRPEIGSRQRVSFALFTPSAAFSFDVPSRDDDTDTLSISFGDGIPSGTYLYALQVDGARSLITASGGTFDAPTVTIP